MIPRARPNTRALDPDAHHSARHSLLLPVHYLLLPLIVKHTVPPLLCFGALLVIFALLRDLVPDTAAPCPSLFLSLPFLSFLSRPLFARPPSLSSIRPPLFVIL